MRKKGNMIEMAEAPDGVVVDWAGRALSHVRHIDEAREGTCPPKVKHSENIVKSQGVPTVHVDPRSTDLMWAEPRWWAFGDGGSEPAPQIC